MARWRGIERVTRIRDRLPAAVKAADAQATEAGMNALAEAIRHAVPVGVDEPHHMPPGTLRDTVRAEKGKREGRFRVVAGGKATTVPVRKGEGQYDYSRGVEFGHLTEKGEHVPAHPFFFTTARAWKAELRRRRRSAIRDAVKRIAGDWFKG